MTPLLQHVGIDPGLVVQQSFAGLGIQAELQGHGGKPFEVRVAGPPDLPESTGTKEFVEFQIDARQRPFAGLEPGDPGRQEGQEVIALATIPIPPARWYRSGRTAVGVSVGSRRELVGGRW